jgi:hypothetical protein
VSSSFRILLRVRREHGLCTGSKMSVPYWRPNGNGPPSDGEGTEEVEVAASSSELNCSTGNWGCHDKAQADARARSSDGSLCSVFLVWLRDASKFIMMRARSEADMCWQMRICLCMFELRPDIGSTFSNAAQILVLQPTSKEFRHFQRGASTLSALPFVPPFNEVYGFKSCESAGRCVELCHRIGDASFAKGIFMLGVEVLLLLFVVLEVFVPQGGFVVWSHSYRGQYGRERPAYESQCFFRRWINRETGV